MINYYLLINLLSYTSCGYFILTEKSFKQKRLKCDSKRVFWVSVSIWKTGGIS